ncbi:MAG: ribonuclease HI [Rhodobacteraceae bacterium]|nr:MAG: ribonuclease HI [Paracoccaceae bacterium]|tara:strand:+ start:35 stop:490 length:456 start_codon:yes stop_codon:yes gene_type:complete
MKVNIFTDGACSGNPGPGGWGALLVAKKNGKVISEKKIYGGEKNTTNNRMELMAAINALNILTKRSEVTIITDSKYLKDGMTKWLDQWLLNNWRNKANKDVKNVDLWKEIYHLSKNHDISWTWVKGHDNHEENEKADYLARLGMEQFKINI